MFRTAVITTLALCAVSAQAEQFVRPDFGAYSAANARLDYDAYVAGFNILAIQAGLELTQTGYTLALHHATAGTIGALIHADMRSRADGAWQGTQPQPRRFVTDGLWRGDHHRIDIEYPSGNPVIRALIPDEADERDPVPESLRTATVDSLSAVAMLIHSVATTGKCDGKVTTYDGRRVVHTEAHTGGQEVLPLTDRSIYSGPSLRCDFDSQEVAGLPHDVDPVAAKRIQHASVWLAPILPSQPPLPVLLQLDTRFLGHVTLYLTASKAAAQVNELTPPEMHASK